jgi:hypothetical protein
VNFRLGVKPTDGYASDPLKYVDDIVTNRTPSNIRFLKYYERSNLERENKWLNSDPKDIFMQNKKRFKQLLAMNLIKKQGAQLVGVPIL